MAKAPVGPCAEHSAVAARYQCDGCNKLLCEECIEESHRLLLCRHCGERALPIGADAPATTTERRQFAKPLGSRNYGIGQALLYPFRGSGLFLFIAAIVSAGVVTFIVRFGFGCFPIVLWLGWLSLIIGIQFKIVASTAKWENELPDWPEYFSFGERVVEILTYLVIALLNWGPLIAFLLAFGVKGIATGTPSIGFWVGVAASLWLGTALSVMAWGGAALHWRRSALRVDQHVRALLATAGDGLKTVNLTFVLFGLVVIARATMGERIPFLGALLGGVLGIYWTFVAPHLVGMLFRRHAATLHGIYEG
jgi:hypothetical protein